MKNHEKSVYKICLQYLRSLLRFLNMYKHVLIWKVYRSPALAPFKTPSASPASTAACAVTSSNHLISPSKHHPSISALPGDLPLLPFASLYAVQAPGKRNDRSCYAIMACLSQSKRQKSLSPNSCYSLWPWFAIRACATEKMSNSLSDLYWTMTQWTWFLSSNFISGGFPSKTYTGLIPFLHRWYLI